MTNTKRGFTLIELLVVIAIIGILSSVVLASLNSARNKGTNAAIKSNLANARAQAEVYYDTGNTYASVCSGTGGIINNVTAATAAAGAGSAAANCDDDADEWAAFATLKNSEGVFCVDYKGYASTTTKTLSSSMTNGDIDCN